MTKVKEELEKANKRKDIAWADVIAIKTTHSKPYSKNNKWYKDRLVTKQYAAGEGSPCNKTYSDKILDKDVIEAKDVKRECIEMSFSLKPHKSYILIREIYVAKLDKSEICNSFTTKSIESYEPTKRFSL